MYIKVRSVTVESITFETLSVKGILSRKKMKSAHFSQADVQK